MTAEQNDQRFVGLAARRGAGLRRFRLRMALAAARSRFAGRGLHASRFQFVPPHFHLADPSIAYDFLAGQIVLAGRSLLSGARVPFDLPPPSRDFAIALHGFEWLRHFEASGQPEIRQGARHLVQQWLDRRDAGIWRETDLPEAIPARVIAWVTHSALIAENVDFTTYRRLLDQLRRDAAVLKLFARRKPLGTLRLKAAIALLHYALALDCAPRMLRWAENALEAALAGNVLPDGGPKDRNAGQWVMVAANLIPVLALYRARQLQAPDFINMILVRMVGFIRLMQQPDGGLALFNGGGLVSRDLVAEVTRFGSGRVARLESAPESGFERLEDEHAVLIADTGRVPPPEFATSAGAGALSFEFSTRFDRLIVNCGMPHSAEGEVRRSFRSAPAHSTILIDDRGLASLQPDLDLLGRPVEALFSAGEPFVPRREHGELIIGHRGLKDATGYAVERHLNLMPDGKGLFGFDRFIDSAESGETRCVTLAFHLHPRVLAVPLSRQDAVMLRLPHRTPGRDMWLFEAPGLTLRLEESRCYEQDITLPKTEAIILDVPISGTTEIPWRLMPYRG